jgi:hypothetical protein
MAPESEYTMRAKFRVDSVTCYAGSREVTAFAVHSGDPEDNQFADATPAGKLSMTVTAGAAKDFFQPGKSYYMDFTPAESQS